MSGSNHRTGTSRGDQIIVATGHLSAVTEALNELEIHFAREGHDEIPELGLTRLELTSLRADAARLRQDPYLVRHAESTIAARRPRDTPASAIDDLDLVMFRLRFDFAYRSGGWMPTMGKNRYVDATEAFGEIGGGGGGPPQAVLDGEIGGGGGPELRQVARAGQRRLIPADGRAGRGVRIGVLDTAIRPHREFAGLRHPRFTATAGSRATTMAGHGVFGAGLILQKAPRARLVSVPVLDDNGEAEVWEVAKAMMTFLRADRRVDLIHMPWGAITPDGEEPLVLAAAVRRLSSTGASLVAAAGNHGNSRDLARLPNAASYPAAMPEVTAVAAGAAGGVPARFSPDPDAAPWIDVVRRGEGVMSTYLDDGYAVWSGSSFAAAEYVGELAAKQT
jgi:membrane-anchored mycosin MYCP